MYMRYNALIKRLSELAVVHRRQEYFVRVDCQGALRQSTRGARKSFVVGECPRGTGLLTTLRHFFIKYKNKAYEDRNE
jgi:hypothetical protein